MWGGKLNLEIRWDVVVWYGRKWRFVFEEWYN